jgi:hypothetical protein
MGGMVFIRFRSQYEGTAVWLSLGHDLVPHVVASSRSLLDAWKMGDWSLQSHSIFEKKLAFKNRASEYSGNVLEPLIPVT